MALKRIYVVKKKTHKKRIVAACDKCFLSFRLNLHKLVPTTTTKGAARSSHSTVSYSVLNNENNSVPEVMHNLA